MSRFALSIFTVLLLHVFIGCDGDTVAPPEQHYRVVVGAEVSDTVGLRDTVTLAMTDAAAIDIDSLDDALMALNEGERQVHYLLTGTWRREGGREIGRMSWSDATRDLKASSACMMQFVVDDIDALRRPNIRICLPDRCIFTNRLVWIRR